jgi:hypothetical protein
MSDGNGSGMGHLPRISGHVSKGARDEGYASNL